MNWYQLNFSFAKALKCHLTIIGVLYSILDIAHFKTWATSCSCQCNRYLCGYCEDTLRSPCSRSRFSLSPTAQEVRSEHSLKVHQSPFLWHVLTDNVERWPKRVRRGFIQWNHEIMRDGTWSKHSQWPLTPWHGLVTVYTLVQSQPVLPPSPIWQAELQD